MDKRFDYLTDFSPEARLASLLWRHEVCKRDNRPHKRIVLKHQKEMIVGLNKQIKEKQEGGYDEKNKI